MYVYVPGVVILLFGQDEDRDDVRQYRNTKAGEDEEDGEYADERWVELEVFCEAAADAGEDGVVASVELFFGVHGAGFLRCCLYRGRRQGVGWLGPVWPLQPVLHGE